MLPCVKFAVAVCLLSCAGNTPAQSLETEKEHAVIELGGAALREITNAVSSFGPSAAVEMTPIKNWLELEFGTTALFRRHSTQWGTDLVFKKPWDISKKVEFIVGLGPEWVHARQNGITTNSISAEALADFMFWPSKKHRFGWYVEPTCEYSFASGHEQSRLLAIPERLFTEAQDYNRKGEARETRLTINCACTLLERAKNEFKK